MQDACRRESTPVRSRPARQFYRREVTNPSDLPPSRGSQPSHGSESSRGSATWLLRLALILFGVGLVAIVMIFLTPILTDDKPGLVLYLVAMLTPVGFVLALTFALLSGRRAK